MEAKQEQNSHELDKFLHFRLVNGSGSASDHDNFLLALFPENKSVLQTVRASVKCGYGQIAALIFGSLCEASLQVNKVEKIGT